MDILTTLKLVWDRVGAAVAVTAGALALLLGYLGVKGTPYVAEQLPYIISGGLFGLFLLGIGATLWISADLRDQWHALIEIRDQAALREADVVTAAEPAPSPPAVKPTAATRRPRKATTAR